MKKLLLIAVMVNAAPCLFAQEAVQRHLFSNNNMTMMISPIQGEKVPFVGGMPILPAIKVSSVFGNCLVMAQAAVDFSIQPVTGSPSGAWGFVPTVWGDTWTYLMNYGESVWRMRFGGLSSRAMFGPKFQ